MLQIISGKFFNKDDPLYIHDGKGILYSNYSWVGPIKTCIAALEPVETYRSIPSYVISYKNQIKKEEGPGSIIRVGDPEIVHQFQLICIFGLKAFFDVDRNNVEINCRERPKSPNDYYLPSKFVSRFFQSEIHGQKSEVETFIKFVDKVIGLPRAKYLVIISCLENFLNALQVLNYNFDLAYSMLVFSLESLSQSFDDFNPTWDDYDIAIKNKLESHLTNIDKNISEDIQKTLLESKNFRLQQRFIYYITNQISDHFFTDEANNIESALRKSELKRVLRNAYTMRSKYAHQLEPIKDQLRNPHIGAGDVFHWDNEPYLTFGGLVRLTYHVLNNFIYNQDYLDCEEYDWRKDLPGIIFLKKAPQYWIWEAEGFISSQATARFSGFLENLQQATVSDSGLVDLGTLLEKYESLIPTAKKEYKISMLATYCLYNKYIAIESRRPDFEEFIDKYNEEFNLCCIEMMIVYLLLNLKWPWEIKQCVSTYEKYNEKKFSKSGLSIPLLTELCLINNIANTYLNAGDTVEYDRWLDVACLESAGKPDIQRIINEHKSKRIEINSNLILKSINRKEGAK